MTHLLNIDEAVDRKYLITKNVKGQAAAGTIIHVMDAETNPGGSVNVLYRVARFNEKFHDYQDYNAKFDSLAAFCKWAQPDNFIARNYEMLSISDIQHYIKVKNRNFTSFCLPLILIAAIIVWVLLYFLLDVGIPMIVLGVILTLLITAGVLLMLKKQKKKEKVRLYHKISSNWGVVLK
ncbi:MAG: hypothetical protein K6G82_06940 [Ruminococcus sp.]|nr:hypothetical protein [Ruminococcus sp.]